MNTKVKKIYYVMILCVLFIIFGLMFGKVGELCWDNNGHEYYHYYLCWGVKISMIMAPFMIGAMILNFIVLKKDKKNLKIITFFLNAVTGGLSLAIGVFLLEKSWCYNCDVALLITIFSSVLILLILAPLLIKLLNLCFENGGAFALKSVTIKETKKTDKNMLETYNKSKELLLMLKELRDKQCITEEEYEEKRKKIVDSM